MPSKTFIGLLVTISCLLGVARAEDIQIGYVEGARYRLGSGIDETTFAARGTAIEKPLGTWVDGGLRRFAVRVVVTSDARQALEELAVDIAVTAKGAYEEFSGEGNYSSKLFQYFTRDSETLHAIIIAEVDFGRYQLDDPTLSAKAGKLAEADIGIFRETYGTHFVAQENRKAVVFCVHSLSKLTSQQKESLTGSDKTTAA